MLIASLLNGYAATSTAIATRSTWSTRSPSSPHRQDCTAQRQVARTSVTPGEVHKGSEVASAAKGRLKKLAPKRSSTPSSASAGFWGRSSIPETRPAAARFRSRPERRWRP